MNSLRKETTFSCLINSFALLVYVLVNIYHFSEKQTFFYLFMQNTFRRQNFQHAPYIERANLLWLR